MKNLILILTAMISITACSQNNNKNMNTINSSNFVENVLKDVKHYNIEPTYWLRIEKDYQAELEIYVNDIPVFRDYDLKEGYSTTQDVNFVILKSGKQKIRYKVNSKKREVYIGIDVKELDNKGKMQVEDEKMVKNYEQTITMPESGVYEGEFSFVALVPYENKGWSEGQDLTKFSKQELETAVVAFYQKMWNIYNDKTKKDVQFPLILERERETAQSLYETKKGLNENLDAYLRPYTNSTYQLQPLENYKMVFYGADKVVALQQTSTDIRLRGKLALWAKYQNEGGKSIRTSFPNLYLYLPQGKSLKDGLQIIR